MGSASVVLDRGARSTARPAPFVFCSKRSDQVKLLAWDGSGIILATMWLEDGRFVWPPIKDGAMCLTTTQVALFLDGLEWSQAAAYVVKKLVWSY